MKMGKGKSGIALILGKPEKGDDEDGDDMEDDDEASEEEVTAYRVYEDADGAEEKALALKHFIEICGGQS
jgi:hypothetical protein